MELTPCPKPDCRAPITHWHDNAGDVFACHFALRGEPCPHGDQGNPCYAPRETAPLHLPDVDAVARKVYESEYGPRWYDEHEHVKDEYRADVQAVLDLIAAHQPVWKRVEPGTLIKEGTRYRRETPHGYSCEDTAAGDFLTGDGGYSIDPRTVPAEPEDPRLAVVVEWSNEPAAATRKEAARDLLARLDALEADR